MSGILPEEAEALREQLPAGRDFLGLSALEGANLLLRLGNARTARAKVFADAQRGKKVAKVAEALALQLDGMTAEEKAELAAVLREGAG